ncbi:hypothetical protein ACLOJK_037258 [Asimina triloba]
MSTGEGSPLATIDHSIWLSRTSISMSPPPWPGRTYSWIDYSPMAITLAAEGNYSAAAASSAPRPSHKAPTLTIRSFHKAVSAAAVPSAPSLVHKVLISTPWSFHKIVSTVVVSSAPRPFREASTAAVASSVPWPSHKTTTSSH